MPDQLLEQTGPHAQSSCGVLKADRVSTDEELVRRRGIAAGFFVRLWGKGGPDRARRGPRVGIDSAPR